MEVRILTQVQISFKGKMFNQNSKGLKFSGTGWKLKGILNSKGLKFSGTGWKVKGISNSKGLKFSGTGWKES